jgi:hypothetical protein
VVVAARRDDVTWLLVAAGACRGAIERLGRRSKRGALRAATPDDRAWAGYGSGSGDGDGYRDGAGAGYGYGYGSGSGSGYWYGDGDGEGYGYGFGDGAGAGYGSGSGYGDGSGDGYGSGWSRIELADGTVIESRAQARRIVAEIALAAMGGVE